MNRLGMAVAALALLGVATGAALAQGRGGQGGGHGGGGPGASGGSRGGQGWSGGGRQWSGGGGQHGAGGGRQWSGGGGQGWSGGRQWAGGGQWSGGYRGGYNGRGAYHGGYNGYRGGWYGYGYRGWYGGYRGWYGGWYPGFSLYFGWPWYGYPYAYGYPAYGYPAYGYPATYPYPGYYAYPAYVDPGPVVYVEKPPVVAAAPPPPPPAPRAEPPKFERYTLSAKELFDFDRTNLRMPQPKLDEIADALIKNQQITHVRIIGYTDRLGSDTYNLQLSQRRADTVKAYLVSKGVAANRLEAIGRGKANPVVECPDRAEAVLIACLEPNRRVEIEPFTIERPYG